MAAALSATTAARALGIASEATPPRPPTGVTSANEMSRTAVGAHQGAHVGVGSGVDATPPAAAVAPVPPTGPAAAAPRSPPVLDVRAEQRTWAWPVAPRPTVARRFEAPAQPWLAGHRGVDLSAEPGLAVLAPADGVVAFRGVVAGRPVLSIDHAGGLRSTYEPVASILETGTAVHRGDVIGTVVAGAHCPPSSCLHWGARRGEAYVDPLRLVGGSPPVLLPMG